METEEAITGIILFFVVGFVLGMWTGSTYERKHPSNKVDGNQSSNHSQH